MDERKKVMVLAPCQKIEIFLPVSSLFLSSILPNLAIPSSKTSQNFQFSTGTFVLPNSVLLMKYLRDLDVVKNIQDLNSVNDQSGK